MHKTHWKAEIHFSQKKKKKKKEPKRKEIINIQTYNKPANSTQLTLVKVLAIVEV